MDLLLRISKQSNYVQASYNTIQASVIDFLNVDILSEARWPPEDYAEVVRSCQKP